MSWWHLGLLAVIAYAFKALGLVGLGSAPLRGRAVHVVRLLPPALLAALVAVESASDGQQLVLDARLLGLAFAGVAVWRRWPFTVVVIGAAAVTALARSVA